MTEVCPISSANVPIIKLCLSGVEIDLLFAKMNFTRIRKEQSLIEDEIIL